MAERSLSDVTTLIFDVMGTVVDIEGSIAAQATAALRGSGLEGEGIDRLLEDWEGRLDRGMQEIIAGDAPWQGHRDLRRASLPRRWPPRASAISRPAPSSSW